MLFEERKYRLTGITPILGSQPCSQEVRTKYVAKKVAEINNEEEQECLPDLEEKGLSIFYMDTDERDALMMMDYQIRGFLKAAGRAIAKQLGVLSIDSKVDKYVFVAPRRIHILRDGKPIYEPDDQYERPLRASTPMGQMVTLAASEQIYDPWTIEFTIKILDNPATKQSKSVTFDVIEEFLDYGALSGIGQFRNGGFGKFVWEKIG